MVPVASLGAVYLGTLRLSTRVVIEAHDETQCSDRRYLAEASVALLNRHRRPPSRQAGPAGGDPEDNHL